MKDDKMDGFGNGVANMVKHYYKTAGITPEPKLAQDLISEEFGEFMDSVVYDEPPQDQLKELSDLVYVIYGYAQSRGWDLDEAISRVHNNNLARMFQDESCGECSGTGLSRIGLVEGMSSYCVACSGDGGHKYLLRNEAGKIVKNPNTPKVMLEDLT